MLLNVPVSNSLPSLGLRRWDERDNLGFRVYGGPNPASKCVGETIYHWRTGWKRRTWGTITRFSVEAVQPNCPSDPGEFARPIYRVDYDARDREELEESEVRILLCAAEPDTPDTSLVTRPTWNLVHHLHSMQLAGIDRSLGFDNPTPYNPTTLQPYNPTTVNPQPNVGPCAIA